MSHLNHLDIYRILEKTNCRQCSLPTCLAFAVAVMKGEVKLGACPHLEEDVLARFEGQVGKRSSLENDWEKALKGLQNKIRTIDFASSAERLGARLSPSGLAINCLGKDFQVDPQGKIISDCHVNPWLSIPLLSYIIHCEGKRPAGQWVPLRELDSGATWSRLFSQRCEKPLKALVDNHTDLFEILIDLFAGKSTTAAFSSDISIVLHPLPKLPMLVCYWNKEGQLDSTLHLFFDSTADKNLNIESIYQLGVGLVTMFEKIALRHAGFAW